MTVENTTRKVIANGNGTATVFSFSPMVIFDSADLVVTIIDEDGVETTLTEGTGGSNYSVSLTSTEVLPSVGSVTYPASGVTRLAVGEQIVIQRVMDLLQETDLETQGGYFPDVQEAQFDRLVMIDQQQQDAIDRSLKLPINDTASSPLLPALDGNAGMAVVVNGDENGFEFGATPSTPVSAAMAPVVAASTVTAALDLLAQITSTSYGRSFLALADAAAARTLAGAQQSDAQLDTLAALASVANLSALAGLTGAADQAAVFTGAGAMALLELSQSIKTFSPTLLGSGGNPTVTYGTQGGYYIRVGPLCFVWGFLSTSAYSGGSTNLRIGNLPFTVNATSSSAGLLLGWDTLNLSAGAVAVIAIPAGSQTYMILNECYDNAGQTSVQVSQWGAATNCYFLAMYRV